MGGALALGAISFVGGKGGTDGGPCEWGARKGGGGRTGNGGGSEIGLGGGGSFGAY